jgi:hypothetical protein
MPLSDYRINLADQQAECALNYARICRLLPQVLHGQAWLFGLPAGERMSFSVKERGPYTTTLIICQSADHLWSNSECQVRVYHDAQMAEVIAFQRQQRIKPVNDYPNPHMHQVDEKAQLNRFLGEWLAHCLAYGHLERDVVAPLDVRL